MEKSGLKGEKRRKPAELFSIKMERQLILFIPLSVLLIGVFNSLRYLNNRNKQFTELAQTKVYRSLSTAIFNVSFGLLGLTNIGLITSNIIAQLFANVNLLRHNIFLKNLYGSISLAQMKKMLSKYSKFPIFDLPANLFFNLYSSMLVFYFSVFMTPTVAGMYFFVNRLLKTPASFFVTSFQDVFFQKISENSDNIAVEAEKFSKQMDYPIIPCDLCGSQDGLQRQQVKKILDAKNILKKTHLSNLLKKTTSHSTMNII